MQTIQGRRLWPGASTSVVLCGQRGRLGDAGQLGRKGELGREWGTGVHGSGERAARDHGVVGPTQVSFIENDHMIDAVAAQVSVNPNQAWSGLETDGGEDLRVETPSLFEVVDPQVDVLEGFLFIADSRRFR
jgi:hypothetical protein